MNSPQRAILILVDGLRPEPVEQGLMPALSHLAAGGTATLKARSVMPSITLPCIASIFLSVPPTRHKTLTNTWHHNRRPLPGLFEMARAGGLLTASFHGWDPLRDLSQPDVLDFAYYHRSGDPIASQTESEVCQFAADWIVRHQPGFSFIYIELPDQLGHKFGYLSPEYLSGCERVDAALSGLFERLKQAGLLDEAVVVVTADHGGHDRTHGTPLPEDMTVPLILHGKGVRTGHLLEGKASILDIAPTITHLLGLPTPPEWQGRVLMEALV